MAKDEIYTGRRRVIAFADLNHGAEIMIGKAEKDLEGNYYTIISSLLLTAFTFEAYLNHLGDSEYWDEDKGFVGVLDKYDILCGAFGILPDYSRRPHQTLRELFKFRDSIAHARSETLEETKSISSTDRRSAHSPKTEWEKYCNLEQAKRAKEDITKIIIKVNVAAGLGNQPFKHGATVAISKLRKPPVKRGPRKK